MLSYSQPSTCCVFASTVITPVSSGYLELEIGIARYGHEFVTRPAQDDMVRSRKVNHLKRERLGVVVARVSEGDRQSDPPEGDGLLPWDHNVE
jgi:hypothetical protein